MSTDNLTLGYYLGIRRAIRNFEFSVPKIGQGVTNTDMDTWFDQLNAGKKASPSKTPSHNPDEEKSTSFSGWFKTDNAVNLSAKCLAAPDICKAAGGGDSLIAMDKVKMFKKKAHAVLERCCDSGEAITEATAAEINVCACCVHEYKVVVLAVSNVERPGFRHDSHTNMWYMEKTVRKFYLEQSATESLLKSFAQELADPTTTVNAERRLVAVRNDRTTPRTGRNARVSNFQIVTLSDQEAMATDAKLIAVANRIKANLLKHQS